MQKKTKRHAKLAVAKAVALKDGLDKKLKKEAEINIKHYLPNCFDLEDKNHSDRISKKELDLKTLIKCVDKQRKLKNCFLSIDSSHSGTLKREDMGKFQTKCLGMSK